MKLICFYSVDPQEDRGPLTRISHPSDDVTQYEE